MPECAFAKTYCTYKVNLQYKYLPVYEKVTNSKILVNKQMQIIFHTVFQTKSTKNVITTNYIHNLTISEQIVQISENFLSNIYNNKLYKYVLIFLET